MWPISWRAPHFFMLSFIYQSKRIIYRWFNRNGGHRLMTLEKLGLILKMLGYPSLWKTRSMFHSG
jgi:hypothetical protein